MKWNQAFLVSLTATLVTTLAWANAARAVDAAKPADAPKPADAAAATTAAPEASPTGADALAAQVFKIFDAKCAACHSPRAGEKAKNFDTVLDFEKLAANPKLIIKGDPAKSTIYKSIEDEEMPPQAGKKADPKLPPLTETEAKAVQDWIKAGAPVGQTKALLAAAFPTPAPKAEKSFFEKLVRWLGNFHPLAAHTPIAVLMAAAISEMLYLKYRSSALTGASRFCAVLGALGAIATAGLGWLMYLNHYKAGQELLENHKWAGTIAGIASLPIALLGEWGARRAHRAGKAWHGFSRWTFRIAIFAIAGLIAFTAHLGGISHWGEEFFQWPK